jgi:hypothetical protein
MRIAALLPTPAGDHPGEPPRDEDGREAAERPRLDHPGGGADQRVRRGAHGSSMDAPCHRLKGAATTAVGREAEPWLTRGDG